MPISFSIFLPFHYRFTPSVNAIIYHGDKKQRDEIRRKHMPRTIGPKFPIVVTSYEVAMADTRRHLRHYDWKYLVVDEVSSWNNWIIVLVSFSYYLLKHEYFGSEKFYLLS